jgi:Ca2+-transporting ATPase
MGKTGTDLTKESSDIILTDDNLNSIVPAIEEGRRTFDNIQKFIFYLLACNSAEIYIMLFTISIGMPVPFTPVMILWANIIIDVPPALALGVDPPERDVLTRKPRDPKAGIFAGWQTYVLVLIHGLSMAGHTFGLFIFAMHYLNYDISHDPDREGPARSLAFIGLGVMQLVHSFLSRSTTTSIFSKYFWVPMNWWLVGGVIFSTIALTVVGYIPVLQKVLNQWPLTWQDWGYIGVALASHIFVVELLKLVFRIHSWVKRRKEQKEEERKANFIIRFNV